MNAPSFKLNKESAQKATRISDAITEKGAYVGQFTRAEYVASRQGTKGIEFDFVATDGGSAKYLTVWFEKGNGEVLSGNNIIHGIMACVSAREMAAQDATVKKYNSETRQEENVRATVFPALMGKPIGVVLVREEYMPTGGGETKWKSALVTPFEASTGRSARERMDNLEAEDIDKLVAALKDRPYRAQSPRGGAQPQRHAPAAGQQGGFEGLDDDIPF